MCIRDRFKYISEYVVFVRVQVAVILCVVCDCSYRVQYSYKPRNPDELELHVGDVVFVVETCADGWFIGTCQRTQEFGTFPGNYVQRMR